MSILDVLDDDFELPSRRSRPYRISLADLWESLDGEEPFVTPSLSSEASMDGLGGPWYSLENEVIEAVKALRAGDFVQVLRSSGGFLFGEVRPEEWEEVPESHFSSPELAAASGGLPDPGDFAYMTCFLFSKRLTRWVLMGEGDEYFTEVQGEAARWGAPRHWRATLAALLAAACLGLYTRGNFTGPEVDKECELQGLYPFPFMASLLPPSEEVKVDTSSQGSPSPLPETSRRQWILQEESSEASPFPLDAPLSPCDAASLRLLSPPCLGDAAYAHICLPQYLATARILLGALTAPVLGGLVSVVNSARSAVSPVSDISEKRKGLLHAASREVPGISRLAGRACALAFRSLAGKGKGVGGGINLLWKECVGHYFVASSSLCPEYGMLFSDGDVFRRKLVEKELLESGAGDRFYGGDDEEEEEGREINSQESSLLACSGKGERSMQQKQQPQGSPRPFIARFLLEWGLVQHSFGKTAGAKTSFFIAKRETGLATLLTGVKGKRTKHASFFTAQLVLKAASVGRLRDIAMREGELAVSLGAAEGKFSGSISVDKVSSVGEGDEATSVGRSGDACSGGEVHATKGSFEEVKEVESEDAPHETLSLPQRVVLGGLRDVTLGEVDSKTELLEKIALADPEDAASLASSEATRHELFYSKGWASTLQTSIQSSTIAPITPPSSSSSLAFKAEPTVQDGPLSTLDQCIVLALCLDVKNHNPSGGLTVEEMKPYVTRVLDTPLNWSVHSAGLYARALLDWENHRTADRAAVQMGALVDAAENSGTRKRTVFNPRGSANPVTGTGGCGFRVSHSSVLALPALWEMKRGVGERYLALGFVRDALHVFSELGLWEEVLHCLLLLEKPRRAEALLHALLRNDGTTTTQNSSKGGDTSRWRLLCSLGTLLNREGEFLAAWEESKGTYGPAALSMASRAASRGDWDTASSFLRAGLKASPGDTSGWFLQGVVCMRGIRNCKNQQQKQGEGGDEESNMVSLRSSATESFSRVVQLDPTRADAWANLGTLHLASQAWERGYGALEQALKADKSDWRIVSNLIVAAVRVGAWGRALSAQKLLLTMACAGGKGEDGKEGSVTDSGVDMAALTTCARVILDAVWGHRKEQLLLLQEEKETVESDLVVQAVSSSANPSLFPQFSGSLEFSDDAVAPLGEVQVGAGEEGNREEEAANPTLRPVDTSQRIHLESLAQLLTSITGKIRPPPMVWTIFADVEDARGKHQEAHLCRERQWRALLSAEGWERSERGVKEVCDCTLRLIELGELLDAWKKAPREWEEQRRFYIDTVVARVKTAVAAAASAGKEERGGTEACEGEGSPLSHPSFLRLLALRL